MAVGEAGSTLCAELNRLANGGTYPVRTEFLDEMGAANKWAGTTGLSLLGALNIKAGITDKTLYQGLNKVCNTIAGTTGLEAITALRGIGGFTPYAPVTSSTVVPAEKQLEPGGVWPYGYKFTDGTELIYGQPGVSISGKTPSQFAWGNTTWRDLSYFGLNTTTVYTDPDQGINARTTTTTTGNYITFTVTHDFNSQPDWGNPGEYEYSDGTVIRQGETKLVTGSTTPVRFVWGNDVGGVQADGWKPRSWRTGAPTIAGGYGLEYPSTVTIVPNYTCPTGGTYNSTTGMCQ